MDYKKKYITFKGGNNYFTIHKGEKMYCHVRNFLYLTREKKVTAFNIFYDDGPWIKAYDIKTINDDVSYFLRKAADGSLFLSKIGDTINNLEKKSYVLPVKCDMMNCFVSSVPEIKFATVSDDHYVFMNDKYEFFDPLTGLFTHEKTRVMIKENSNLRHKQCYLCDDRKLHKKNRSDFSITLSGKYENKFIDKIWVDKTPHAIDINGIINESKAFYKNMYVYEGDMTKMKVDAIVNAANSKMMGGGGIDLAIHTAAGGKLLENYEEKHRDLGGGRCPTGKAVLVPAFKLPALSIINATGPMCGNGSTSNIKNGVDQRPPMDDNKKKSLKSCYSSCLKLAKENNLKSIVFCCISTAIFGCNSMDACEIAVDTCLKEGDDIDAIIFCCYAPNITSPDLQFYEKKFELLNISKP